MSKIEFTEKGFTIAVTEDEKAHGVNERTIEALEKQLQLLSECSQEHHNTMLLFEATNAMARIAEAIAALSGST